VDTEEEIAISDLNIEINEVEEDVDEKDKEEGEDILIQIDTTQPIYFFRLNDSVHDTKSFSDDTHLKLHHDYPNAEDGNHSANQVISKIETAEHDLQKGGLLKKLFYQSGVSEDMLWALDEFDKGLEKSGYEDNAAIIVSAVKLSTATLSVLATSWTLRGGSLVASFLSTMPIWRGFDPLPILDADPGNDLTKSNDDVDKMFENTDPDNADS